MKRRRFMQTLIAVLVAPFIPKVDRTIVQSDPARTIELANGSTWSFVDGSISIEAKDPRYDVHAKVLDSMLQGIIEAEEKRLNRALLYGIYE